MRRRDFEVVAQAMNDSKPRGAADDSRHMIAMDQWFKTCASLADAFEEQSPGHFERLRFMRNCGATITESPSPIQKFAPTIGQNIGKEWDSDMDRQLLEAFEAGKSVDECAVICGRTRPGTRARLERLGRLQPEPLPRS